MVHDSLLAAKKISYRTYQKKFNKFTNFLADFDSVPTLNGDSYFVERLMLIRGQVENS
jgi:hypothetical protein